MSTLPAGSGSAAWAALVSRKRGDKRMQIKANVTADELAQIAPNDLFRVVGRGPIHRGRSQIILELIADPADNDDGAGPQQQTEENRAW